MTVYDGTVSWVYMWEGENAVRECLCPVFLSHIYTVCIQYISLNKGRKMVALDARTQSTACTPGIALALVE